MDLEGLIMVGGIYKSYKIEGIGNDFVLKIMDIFLVDKVIKVNDDEVFENVWVLVKKEGLIVGLLLGVIFVVVIKLLNEIESGNIVVVFLDRGDRYLSIILFYD